MKFNERLKKLRLLAGLSQSELAAAAGISMRSVQNYESGKRYPNSLEITKKLAEILGTGIEYLLGEDYSDVSVSEFLEMRLPEESSTNDKREIRTLVSQLSCLFAGGEIDDDDRDAAMQALTEAYIIAKAESRKYAPKRKNTDKNKDAQ